MTEAPGPQTPGPQTPGPKTPGSQTRGPLHGIRVLDFSRVLAGPYCTMQLADMGAEVIKIENPDGGDDTRGFRPPEAGGEAHYFLAYNRNKKSVALDIRSAEGQAVVHDLAATCDVLIENYRVGVMKRFGLHWEAMRERHPHLVYTSVSAYGQQGPQSDRPGFDPVVQAETGMMSITGEADGPWLRHPLSIIDTFTAIHATAAIAAALYARRDTGRGQYIELALTDAAVAALGNSALYYLTSGQQPPRTGNSHPTSIPTNLFQTKTGPIYISVAPQRLFATLCRDVLKRPELIDDARFASPAARSANRDALYALLDETFMQDTRESWLVRMRDLPAGAVRTLAEALEDPALAERGMVTTVDHPTAGPIRLLGSVYNFSDTPVVPPAAPPLLGQHTDEVLGGLLGYDAGRIAALREARVIG